MSLQNPRRPRRGSAVGLLNADDDAAYGGNTKKHGRKKGSFLSRVKQNVGQTIEAARTSTANLNAGGGIQLLVSKSGHYSAEKEMDDSDEWESDDEFASNDSFGNDDPEQDNNNNSSPVEPNNNKNQNSAFDQTFDFDAAFGNTNNNNNGKQLDVSEQSFFDEDGSEQFVVRSTVKSLGIKARGEEGSKARAERRRSNSHDDGATPTPQDEVSQEMRKSNDNLLSRRLEDTNLTKIKYGDEASILQFSPLDLALPTAKVEQRKSEPISIIASSSDKLQTKKQQQDHPISKSEQFTLGTAGDSSSGDNKKKNKNKPKRIRRNNSMPSEKVLRRAQRRSVNNDDTEGLNSGGGRSAPKTRKVRRNKSMDDAPFDMTEKIDVNALVESMKEKNSNKKSDKKRGSSRARLNNSSTHSSRNLGSSSHHSKTLDSSSRHNRTLGSSSHHRAKSYDRTKSTRSLAIKSVPPPTEITQPSGLDVRF